MKLMGLAVLETTSGNQSTNQRPVFDGKSLERDSMVITSEGQLGEFTVAI